MKERIYNFKNSRLRVLFGNILRSHSDILVSSDDYKLSMGGGVSRSIKRGAGESVLLDTCKFIPAKLGDVVVTSAGQLKNKYVFHVVTIGPESSTKDERTNDVKQFILENSINKCFRLLSTLELNSIAFPAIGAGVAGIPYEEVASHMIRTIANNLMRTNKSLEVELYLYDRWGRMSEFDFMVFFENIGMYLPKAVDEFDVAHEKNPMENDDTPLIFISYSRKDIQKARDICTLLQQQKVNYWIDEDGRYSGNNFKGVIVTQIKKSAIILFLSSENSNQSQNVVKEIGLAVKNDKPIIPIKFDTCSYDVNIEYDLCNIDYIEYSHTDDFTKRLIDNINMYLQR